MWKLCKYVHYNIQRYKNSSLLSYSFRTIVEHLKLQNTEVESKYTKINNQGSGMSVGGDI